MNSDNNSNNNNNNNNNQLNSSNETNNSNKRLNNGEIDNDSSKVEHHTKKKYKLDNSNNNNKNNNSNNNSNINNNDNSLDQQQQQQQQLDKKSKREKFKHQQKEAIYGNYHGYYSYRNEKSIEKDPRLKYFKKEYFYQKNCLDIGCNSGDLVFKISKDFGPSNIVGVDIDKYLINKAHRELLLEKNKLSSNYNTSNNSSNNSNSNSNSNDNSNNNSNNSNSSNENQQEKEIHYQIKTTLIDSNNIKIIEKKNFIPISFRMISDGIISNKFPHNISFYCHNFLYQSKSIDIPKSYDLISALSISKWIHLNWGDEGIKKFFYKIYDLLKDGGIFLFEPQPFKGYSKRRHLTELINQNFTQIQFRPNQFIDFLINQVKFKSFEFLNESESKSKGFDRPLYKLIK